MSYDDDSQLCVTSYNSTGFGQDKIDFIRTLLLFSDIFCIQEHFLLSSTDRKHSNTSKLRQAFGDDFDMYPVPAVKNNDIVSRGRGKGGLCTMWKKGLTKYVSKINSNNYRVHATRFPFPSTNLLIINSYCMCDPQTDFDDTELYDLLAEIKRIIDIAACENISIQGDLNCDFRRQTPFVQIVRNFCTDMDIQPIFSNPKDTVPAISHAYCQLRENEAVCSLVDHFIVNKSLYDAILEAGSIQSDENFSWHDPIYFKIGLSNLNLQLETLQYTAKPSWNKASEENKSQFTECLNAKLANLDISNHLLQCKDLNCKIHIQEINNYCEDLLEAVDESAVETIPISKPYCKSKFGFPGWNDLVKPYKDEALHWRSLWLCAGRPNSSPLYYNMKSSKAQYKYAVRRLKKSAEQIQNSKFLESLLDGKSGNIYKEIKKFRGEQKTVSSRIDDEVGSENIANHFAFKYSDLYSKCNLGKKFDSLKKNIENSLCEQDQAEVFMIDENIVKEAIKKMKGGKADVTFGFSSDCLMNGPDALYKHLASLFRAFLIHGQVASILLLCSLIPIVKNGVGDLTSSDNYRAIAKSALVLKVFDWVLLLSQGEKLSSDQLQFGYQQLSSTVMCTWAVSSVVSHFNRAGNDVFGALLDCSKAFDMVDWVLLFEELIKRKVSAVFLRVLLFIYSKQQCDVQWNGRGSFKFSVTNGVRQGAVSSPILFNIYVDKLIKQLRSSKLGCRIGHMYYGIMVYADDIVLLCPSRMGLQAMMDICQKFAESHNLQFSTNCNPVKSKTKCIHFSKKRVNLESILLNGNRLPWVESANHVGNILERNNSFNQDVKTKRGSFIGRVHSILQEFSFANPLLKMKVIDVYASSFYGSCLWNFFSGQCDTLYTAWNNAIREAFSLPKMTHRYLIEHISEH